MRRWEVNIKLYLSEMWSNCEVYIYVTKDRAFRVPCTAGNFLTSLFKQYGDPVELDRYALKQRTCVCVCVCVCGPTQPHVERLF